MSRRGGRSKRKVETVVLSDDDDDVVEEIPKNTKKRTTKLSKKQKGGGSKEEVTMDDDNNDDDDDNNLSSSDGNEKEFEVESIMGERIKNGEKQYHIKWKGFEELTWEPDDYLTNCDELFEEWEQKKIAMNESKKNEEKKEKKEKKIGKKRKEKGSNKEEKRAEDDGKQESGLLSPLKKRLSMSEQASLIEEKHHQLKRLEENDRANDTSSYEYTNHQVRLSSSIHRSSSNHLSSPSSSFSSSDAPAPPAAASSITADNRMVIESDDSDSDNDDNDNNDDDDEESYEVEQIIDSRLNGEKYLYKVKWKGWSIDDCTWEPEENLENSKALLLSYLQNNMEQLQYMERNQ